MDLTRVDLNLLVALEALVSERSVTRAARRLGVGQSAMSSTLGRLRAWFNDPLLIRDGRGLVATPLAESLLGPVREVLTDVEKVLSPRRAFDPVTDEATFSVLITDYHLTFTFLRPLLTWLSAEAPRVRLNISPAGEDFADRLQRHDTDLLIVPEEAMPGYEQFHHRVAADLDHPDLGQQITYEQFCTLPYIATWTGHQQRSLIESQLDSIGVPRNVEVTTEFGIAPFLLNGTKMITVLHERLAIQISAQTNLRLFTPPVEGLHPTTELMVWTERTDGDAAHRWFRRRLMELAADLVAND